MGGIHEKTECTSKILEFHSSVHITQTEVNAPINLDSHDIAKSRVQDST